MSVPHAATAINNSPPYRATSPGAYFNKENADMGLENFIIEYPLFRKYAGYETAIRKVAHELSTMKQEDNGSWTYTFSNGFEDLPRSRYLISRYIEVLPEKKDFLDTEVGREIFVVVEMDCCPAKYEGNDGSGWLEYLRLFENGDLEGAKARFAREVSPSYSPSSPSFPPSFTPEGSAAPRNDMTPAHPTSTDAANMTPAAGAGGGQRASKAENNNAKKSSTTDRPNPTGLVKLTKTQQEKRDKHYANMRANLRKSKRRRSPGGDAEDSPRGQKAPRSEAESEIESEATDTDIELQFPKLQSREEARKTLYEDDTLKQRWEKYSGQITTLTRYIVMLIDGHSVNFPEGSESVLDILSTNPLTKKIYNSIYGVNENNPDLWDDLGDKFGSSEIAYEYLVIDVMNQDVQEIADGLFEVDPSVTAYEDWVSFLEKIHPNIEDPQQLLAMRLGSELHTFPADASRELTIDRLTRRLDALRDW